MQKPEISPRPPTRGLLTLQLDSNGVLEHLRIRRQQRHDAIDERPIRTLREEAQSYDVVMRIEQIRLETVRHNDTVGLRCCCLGQGGDLEEILARHDDVEALRECW